MTTNIFNYSINDGFLWSEVNLKGEKKYFIEGYASTIDEDKAGEILDMSAQQDIYNQMQNENITMDIEHEEWYSNDGKLLQRPKNEKIPVAKIVHAELRPKGVWVKAQLNTNLRSFSEVWGSIKDGFLKAFSVAFYPIQKAGGVIQHLNLVNVTLTGSPVNPNATFAVSMKSAAAWMDTQELKAEYNPELSNPADSQSVKQPKNTEIKSEEKKMAEKEFECKKCDKEFESKEAFAEHMEKTHGKEEKEPETKCDDAKVKAEEPVIDIQAEVKAMRDAHEAEIKALQTEVANLKAELAKPVMKATVEEKMPEEKPIINMVSPLRLVR
jgi:phage head maturation protease/uncharacterized C2H2 Zn-finger protein